MGLKKLINTLLVGLTFALSTPSSAYPAFSHNYKPKHESYTIIENLTPINTDKLIVIDKKKRRLYAYSYDKEKNQWELLLRGKASIAINPGDKERRGDEKTPEGLYRIIRIDDSRDWFFRGEKVYGPYFLRLDYPNNIDKSLGKTGGGIGIHGTNSKSTLGTRETQGCIRLSNRKLEELVRWIYNGKPRYGDLPQPVPVIILPERDNEQALEEIYALWKNYGVFKEVYARKDRFKSDGKLSRHGSRRDKNRRYKLEEKLEARLEERRRKEAIHVTSSRNRAIERAMKERKEYAKKREDKKQVVKNTGSKEKNWAYSLFALPLFSLPLVARRILNNYRHRSSTKPSMRQSYYEEREEKKRYGPPVSLLEQRIIDLYSGNLSFSEISRWIRREYGIYMNAYLARDILINALKNHNVDPSNIHRSRYDSRIAKSLGYESIVIDLYKSGVKVKEIINEFKRRTGMNISKSTIYRILKQRKIKKRRISKKSSQNS